MLFLTLKVVGRSFLVAVVVSLLSLWLFGLPEDDWAAYCVEEGAEDPDCEEISEEMPQSLKALGLAIDMFWVLVNFCIPFAAALAANIWSTLVPIKRA
jgi:hypothetical protein